ncbi:MAG: hypothetical protein GVY16_03605 [Planctomycetes bacterium]|jgi:hypothetical protein|nr:hypothetical protein [Planctomycetota bacterium]
MRWIAPAFLTLIAASAFAQPQAADPNRPERRTVKLPSPPRLPTGAKPRLPTLARQAMLRYLSSRQPAADQPIPDALQAEVDLPAQGVTSVATLPYAAVVTLRQDGRLVGTALGDGRGLARNVIAAALDAMRSPALPDRITSEVLLGLTVELSILGEQIETDEDVLLATITPGLTGVKLVRGLRDPGLRVDGAAALFRSTHVLPSTACVLGWNAARMRTQCLRELGHNPMATGLKGTWYTFRAAHIVDYPGRAGTWQLYRGKILTLPETIDADALAAARDRVAAWLMRHVDEDGRAGEPLADQLYAAWVLARYGRQRDNKDARGAARVIIGGVARNHLRLSEDEMTARVITARPADERLATAMFLLATTAMPADPKAVGIQTKLARYLLASPPEDADGFDVLTRAVAVLALRRATLPNAAPPENWTATLLQAARPAGDGGMAEGRVATATLAWVVRAALAPGPIDKQQMAQISAIVGRIGSRQSLLSEVLDRYGGYLGDGPEPRTLATGLAVAMLAEAASAIGGPGQAEAMREQLAGPMTDARRFCARMLYRPAEAYFVPAAQRPTWDGAARIRPDRSTTSVKAAAAALEALMTE